MVELEKIKITDIIPADYNPRKITQQEYLKLSRSISEYGVVDPIIINLQNKRIIGGHQRYEVLMNEYTSSNKYNELNILELGDIGWVFPDTDLKIQSEQHEKALNIALNKISGEWDNEKLELLLDDLQVDGFDVDLTGFDKLDFEKMDLNIHFEEDTELIIPDFQPVEDDTRLDEKTSYSIKVYNIPTESEQIDLYDRLKEEGYTCQKN